MEALFAEIASVAGVTVTVRDRDTMQQVRVKIEDLAKKMQGYSGADIDSICREAAINAVLHGNQYDPAKQIAVSFENTGKALVFTIADQGRGLDAEKLPDPLAPENLLRGTGRGIFLIRSFMDEVHFRQLHPGTELTLIKHLALAVDKL